MHVHSSSNDEILSIRQELLQLDDAAREIANKRVLLLRRLGALQSKTGVLPPETLSLIFQHTIESSEFPNERRRLVSPHFLGSVSNFWRQVAWSTPQLWVTLSLSIYPGNEEKFSELLTLYLNNVRGLPMTLELDFHWKYSLNWKNDPIAPVFFKEENMRKYKVLKLNGLPSSWLSRFNVLLPKLVEIHLGDGDPTLSRNTTFLTNSPVLNRLSLLSTSPPYKVPWSQITNLKLERVPVASVFRCLLDSPRLVEFYFVQDLRGEMDLDDTDQDDNEELEEIPEMPDTLVLPHLHTLQWSFMLNRASDLFLHRIRLPSLRSLIWNQRRAPLTGPFSPGTWSFFQNLSNSPLTTLCLSEAFYLDATLAKHIYYKNPQIENIRLVNCNEETLCTALAALISLQREGVDEGSSLVKLKALEIQDCVDGTDYLANVLPVHFGNIVADLLIGRTGAGPTSKLSVDFVFNHTAIEWSPEAKEKLREIIRDDAAVSLWVNGKRLCWE